MEIRRVISFYFSPTGNTKKICEAIAGEFGCENVVMDRTAFEARYEKAVFGPEDLVILGVPVYYGRVPRIMTEFFQGIEVHGACAAYITTFGNRDYEDALLELKNRGEEKGFLSVAAGAFVGRHSYSEKMGAGRPDAGDLAEAAAFGREIWALIENTQEFKDVKLRVRGNVPYKAAPDLPIAPSVSDACSGCGICAKNCPVAAINPADPRETDGWRCLACARCVRNCPKQARAFSGPAMQEKILVMEAMFQEPKKNEVFLAQ